MWFDWRDQDIQGTTAIQGLLIASQGILNHDLVNVSAISREKCALYLNAYIDHKKKHEMIKSEIE